MKFHELPHTYTNNNDTYRSVTSILKSLEPKKDWKKIAKAYAIKNNLTLKEVEDKWQYEKDISIDRGKKYHAAEEASLLQLPSGVILEDDIHHSVTIIPSEIVNGIKESSNLKLEDGIYPELMVWLDSCRVAGQADKVEILNNNINIIDYKTNKKIDKFSWVNKYGKSEKLLFPCQHLDNCNFNIYSLQLNTYAYIIRRHNPQFKIGQMILRHIQFNSEGVATGCLDYKVPDMQKEVRDILNLVKNNKL